MPPHAPRTQHPHAPNARGAAPDPARTTRPWTRDTPTNACSNAAQRGHVTPAITTNDNGDQDHGNERPRRAPSGCQTTPGGES